MDENLKTRLLESIDLLKQVAEWEFDELKKNPYYKAHKDHQPVITTDADPPSE